MSSILIIVMKSWLVFTEHSQCAREGVLKAKNFISNQEVSSSIFYLSDMRNLRIRMAVTWPRELGLQPRTLTPGPALLTRFHTNPS